MMLFDKFDEYSENLLLAQYDVSEIIEHQLLKGEVREDFLIDVLKSRFEPPPTLRKGTISDGTTQAGQLDVMLCKPNAQIFQLGTQAIVRPEDCLCLFEVKSNATGGDIRGFNDRAARIKAMNAPTYPLFGIFCYNIALQERTILNRFGFDFDTDTQTYFDATDEVNGVMGRDVTYPNIDFIVCVEPDNSLYLRKKNRWSVRTYS